MTITEEGFAIIENDTHIGRWVRESHRLDHDAAIRDTIVPMLKPDWWIVDGGANIGTHTIPYAQACPAGWVFAFEPNPQAYECLKHNLKQAPNASAYNCGLSDKDERREFLVDANAGGSYLSRNREGGAHCIPLDSLNLPKCDFFKLDVEGYELFALKGAEITISCCKPIILVEMNAGTLARNGVGYQDIFEFLSKIGYEWKSFGQNCDLMNEPQYDLLATPKV